MLAFWFLYSSTSFWQLLKVDGSSHFGHTLIWLQVHGFPSLGPLWTLKWTIWNHKSHLCISSSVVDSSLRSLVTSSKHRFVNAQWSWQSMVVRFYFFWKLNSSLRIVTTFAPISRLPKFLNKILFKTSINNYLTHWQNYSLVTAHNHENRTNFWTSTCMRQISAPTSEMYSSSCVHTFFLPKSIHEYHDNFPQVDFNFNIAPTISVYTSTWISKTFFQ